MADSTEKLKRVAGALSKLGSNVATAPEGEAAGIKAVSDNVNQYAEDRNRALGIPKEEPKPDTTVYPQDRINVGRHYGDRPGEKRISDQELKEMTHPLGQIPVYDDGGDVDVNDGKHQLAIVEEGERVLTPEQNAAYKAAQGLPVESRKQPAGITPIMPKVGPLGTAYPQSSGDTEQPNSDHVALIKQDKEDAAQKGDLVGMGNAILADKHVVQPEMPKIANPGMPRIIPAESPLGSALPTYGGPGKAPAAGELIPTGEANKDEHKFKVASYDQQIQNALDKAAETNNPAFAEQADRLRIAKAQYLKNTPWGSESNHPGILGKIGHVAAGIGNIAGDIVAPETMALIPGTQLYKQRQNAGYAKMLSEDEEANLKNQTEKNKAASAGVGKTPRTDIQ